MPKLLNQFKIDRCPHCSVSRPDLPKVYELVTHNHSNSNKRAWRFYKCTNCGGIITATAPEYDQEIVHMFPEIESVDDAIPARAREYIKQAIDTIHAPAGSVMLAASAVDSMLREKGYNEGGLLTRIKQAAEANLITDEMAIWAHEVRLDVNDQGHADESASLPNEADAKRMIEFVSSFAQYLFVLPNRIKRGIESAKR